ncbi:MAG TPA: hypothetical protein PK504_12975 [Ferruginibacter sp.]|nr:hypothetical protein [Ferruginibacter sp.]HRE64664.1 hypothetical protein [Ferruginibacter sp.]
MHNFTTEDLLQYLYNETSAEKKEAMNAALISDWSLREKLETLVAPKATLDSIQLVSPRKSTLESILNYAEKSVEEFSEKV